MFILFQAYCVCYLNDTNFVNFHVVNSLDWFFIVECKGLSVMRLSDYYALQLLEVVPSKSICLLL